MVIVATAFFGMIVGLLADPPPAPPPAPPPVPGWKTLAAESQPALLTLARPVDDTRSYFFGGFFISKEGHAICDLRALTGTSLPTELWIENRKSTPEIQILAVFPSQTLTLLKFNYRPGKWLTLSEVELPFDAHVAFLMPDQIPPLHTGQVLGKWKSRDSSRPVAPYTDCLSIGTSPPGSDSHGLSTLRGGFPLIDREGGVRGSLSGIAPSTRQLLVLAVPLHSIAKQIRKAIEKPTEIRFPIPAELNPIDPVPMTPAFQTAVASMMRGDTDQALTSIQTLLETHPDSAVVRKLQLDTLYEAKRMVEVKALLDELEHSPDGTGFSQVDLLNQKAILLGGQPDLEPAIATIRKIVEITPDDHPEPLSMLASYQRLRADRSGNKEHYLEAERTYRAVIAISPERIDVLTGYQHVLACLHRREEANDVSKRIRDLEAIYRRR